MVQQFINADLKQVIEYLKKQYQILNVYELGEWTKENYLEQQNSLDSVCRTFRKEVFKNNERLVFVYDHDVYVKDAPLGTVLRNLQFMINKVDISNPFVIVLSSRDISENEINELRNLSSDPESLNFIKYNGPFYKSVVDTSLTDKKEIYQYGNLNPAKINLADLSERQRFLLTESKYFCMLPWIHLHAFPTGDAYPCCHSKMQYVFGNVKNQSMKEIWNEKPMRQLRTDMLSEQPNQSCTKCYEQEASGFFSGRQSANKHHGHYISKIDNTLSDGTLPEFQMVYWDIRFSNLCNLSCRSCGHIFSSSWYRDQTILAGPEWKKNNKPFLYVGKHETDVWEQLIEHIDYVEQIYFAGGEPLMMDEHYRILEELERRGRFDVRLVYNTNFTQTKLKDRYVFDYWKKFDSVSVGASLDAMGPRAEYIRKGTDWNAVEENRRKMIEVCPGVDFYISCTLSILNAWHLPDFHREWVEKGLIRPQDLNVNILLDPKAYRMDIATAEYKNRIREKYEKHLEWLRPLDKFNRAIQGFESAITYMHNTDNSSLIPDFWKKTNQLDEIRKESLLDVIPELAALK